MWFLHSCSFSRPLSIFSASSLFFLSSASSFTIYLITHYQHCEVKAACIVDIFSEIGFDISDSSFDFISFDAT